MLPLAPTPSRGAAAVAAGLLFGAAGRALTPLVGAQPLAVGALIAGALLTFGLAGLPVARRWRFDSTRGRLAAAALSLVGLLALEPASFALGRAGLAAWALPGALVAIWCVGQAPMARRLGAPLRAAGAAAPALVAVGLLAGCLAPAWAGGLLGAALGTAVGAAAPPPAPEARPGAPWLDALPLAAVAAAAPALVAAPRGATTPTAAGLAAFGVLALLGLAAGRARAPRSPAVRDALAGAGIAGLALLTLASPGLARDLVLARPAVGLPASVWLLLPALGGGLALGLVGGVAQGRSRHPAQAAAAGLGLLLGLIVEPDPALLIGGLGAALLLLSEGATRRAVGAALAGGALALSLLAPAASPEGAVGAWRLLQDPTAVERDAKARASLRTAGGACAGAGCWTVRAEEAAFAPDSERPRRPRWTAELDGLMAQTQGRDAEAEQLAGLLGGALHGTAPVERALLLGDDTGQVLRPLLQRRPGLVEVAVPSPALLQAAAALDPAARDAWLHPAVLLLRGHPEAVLRAGPPVDLLIEVVRAPWRDAAHAVPDAAHLRAVRRRLAPGGRYLLVLHLGWWPSGGPASVARDVASRFDHVQLWLPPSGVDSLILAAGDAPPRLDGLLAGALLQTDTLTALGLPGPDILASFAVGDGQTARDWADSRGGSWSPHRLSAAVDRRPTLHLDALADRVAAPEAMWDLTGEPLKPGVLEARLEARQTFLRLLAEAARGDMGDVFAAARRLVDQEGAVATQALSVLIEPHMAQARTALLRAQVEGTTSSGWQEAQRFATTARMLSPRSPEPALLLAEIALQQKNWNAAVELFEGVLELDPGHLSALNGLARTARARRDLDAAARWLREATTAHSQDWTTWQRLGALHLERGELDQAEQALRRASSLAGPERAEPHVALAELYLATGRPTTALVHAERAVQLKGGSRAWFVRGRAHFDLGELERAGEDFRRSIELDGQAIPPWEGIAMVRGRRGDLSGAAEALRTLLALDPDHDIARENLRRIEDDLRAREVVAPDGRPVGP